MLQTGSKVRLAQRSDEAEVINLIRVMHAESGLFPLDDECVRRTLARVWNRQGGTLAVIGAPGEIRAMMLMQLATAWYTAQSHLEETFCWVHPEHRKSDYSKLLMEYAKHTSDLLSERAGHKMTLLIGVLTSLQMAPKVRLYRRMFGIPVGAFFAHNAAWVTRHAPAEEDFWRIPKLSKLLSRQTAPRKREKVA